jgi:hypothetical protein
MMIRERPWEQWHTRGPRRIGQRAGEDIYLVVAK